MKSGMNASMLGTHISDVIRFQPCESIHAGNAFGLLDWLKSGDVPDVMNLQQVHSTSLNVASKFQQHNLFSPSGIEQKRGQNILGPQA